MAFRRFFGQMVRVWVRGRVKCIQSVEEEGSVENKKGDNKTTGDFPRNLHQRANSENIEPVEYRMSGSMSWSLLTTAGIGTWNWLSKLAKIGAQRPNGLVENNR